MKEVKVDGTETYTRLAKALAEIEKALLVIIAPDSKEKQLPLVGWMILRELYKEDSLPAGELAKRVGRAATSFTPILDKVEELGLVERHANSKDRRAIKVCLTEAGKQRKRRTNTEALLLSEYVEGRLSENDLIALKSILDKFN